jgi:hypothetical protein
MAAAVAQHVAERELFVAGGHAVSVSSSLIAGSGMKSIFEKKEPGGARSFISSYRGVAIDTNMSMYGVVLRAALRTAAT